MANSWVLGSEACVYFRTVVTSGVTSRSALVPTLSVVDSDARAGLAAAANGTRSCWTRLSAGAAAPSCWTSGVPSLATMSSCWSAGWAASSSPGSSWIERLMFEL